MNLHDKILYGFCTQKEISDLINTNIANAKTLQIRMWWEFDKKTIVARMTEGGKLIYENKYQDEHIHVIMAKMHYNWSLVLDKKINARRHEEHRKVMIERWRMGGQDFDVTDEPEDTRLTLGERAAMRIHKP